MIIKITSYDGNLIHFLSASNNRGEKKKDRATGGGVGNVHS